MHEQDDWINDLCRVIAVVVGAGIVTLLVYHYVL